MTDTLDEILDDTWHGCAFMAYVQVAAELNSWPPPSEPTRLCAYALYEATLREKQDREPLPAVAASGNGVA